MSNPSRETKFSGANGDGEILFFAVQLTTRRIGKLTPVNPYSCYMNDHTYIHMLTQAATVEGADGKTCSEVESDV